MAAVVTSVTGLQNLTNLNNFNADYNGLQSVNLSGLTNLTDVDISDNDIPGSGGTSSLTSVNLSGCYNLEELRLDDSDFSAGIPNLYGLESLRYIDFDQCLITGSVDISGLSALDGFDFSGNEELTELVISNVQPLGDTIELLVYNCALTQTAVDDILVALAANSINNGYIDLTGGTNAVPGAAGLAALTTLTGKGWSYDVNS